MAIQNKKIKKVKKQENQEFDGVFIMKVAVLVILGSLWLKVTKDSHGLHIPIPVGLIVGLLVTQHELFRVDRKIEYAVLVCAALFGYVAPYGLFLAL